MFRIVLCYALFAFSVSTGFSQNETVIQVRLKNSTIPWLRLGTYYGDKSYLVDSARVDTMTGYYSFSRPKMHAGAYFIAVGRDKLFDFMVEKPGTPLVFDADLSTVYKIDAGKSRENAAFFEFHRYRKRLEEKVNQLKSSREMIAKATHNDPKSLEEIDQAIRVQFDSLDQYVVGYIAKYPDFLFTRMLRATQSPVPPPDIPQMKDNRPNIDYLRWVGRHYWDKYDFADDRLLFSEFYISGLKSCLNKFLPQQPDSIAEGIDGLLAKMPKDSQFYRFTVVFLTQQFEANTDQPGFDRLFVHMVDRYQKVKETPWLDQATLLRLEDKANFHRPNLTGNPAPALQLPDENGKMVSLHEVEGKYTLLIFYSALCSHCMEQMPHLYEAYKEYGPKGLKAIAVNSDNQPDNWKKFLKEKKWTWINVADPKGENAFQNDFGVWNMPVVYLLDKDKTILFKRIKLEKLQSVLKILFK
jgi:peroxiredoxin